NASKCGIMAINTDQSISGSIQNKPIPLIDQYTYLGLIFNKKWQSKQTVQNNKNKMEKAMYASFNFLKNPSIPTNIRLMVLKSVLIPIGTYGGELFGMSEQRCKPIQRVADNALRIIANVGKSAPMHRIRQEMGVTSINTRASDVRERAYFKYPHPSNLDIRRGLDLQMRHPDMKLGLQGIGKIRMGWYWTAQRLAKSWTNPKNNDYGGILYGMKQRYSTFHDYTE
ncbi:hypothetical protein BB560_006241, partial [Smittium megazygosporum]